MPPIFLDSTDRARFVGGAPGDRLYDITSDMWVLVHDDGTVSIGATSYGVWLAGEIIGFTAKPRGAVVERGRSLGTVECAKTVIAVHSPLSFTLDAANEALEDRAAAINSDPYGSAWMARGRPQDWQRERALLVDAIAYRAHVLAHDPEARFE